MHLTNKRRLCSVATGRMSSCGRCSTWTGPYPTGWADRPVRRPDLEWHKGARVVEYYQACSDNMIGTQVYCWITCGGLIGTNGGYAEVGAIRARDVSDLVAEVVEECRGEVSRLFRAFFRGGGLLPGLGLCLRLWVSLRERLRRWQPERKGEHGDRNQPVRRGPPEHLHPPRAERESKTPARLADSALTDSV